MAILYPHCLRGEYTAPSERGRYHQTLLHSMHLLSCGFRSVIFPQVKSGTSEEEAGVGGGCGGRDRISQ